MFVGRERELAELERLYAKGGFQMVVLYGRRRVGKTTLALEFAKDKPLLFFTAKLQSDPLNLAELSRQVNAFFGNPAATPSFRTWDDAFAYLAQRAGDSRIVFMFDEFPFAAKMNQALVSTLQIAVDRTLAESNIFLIVSGSNQGFMEEQVLGRSPIRGGAEALGEKNPLFGRRTGQIHLGPFNYRDAASMLSWLEPQELVEYYACFGGTPYYLSQLDSSESLAQNICRLYFQKEGMLYEEPMMLLRQELREPALYNSILSAIAAGANTPAHIADRIGSDRTTVGKYLATLVNMHLIRRSVPFGETSRTSRKGIYAIADPCFAFWYRFVEPSIDNVERGAGDLAAMRVVGKEPLSTYEGHWFEEICIERVIDMARRGELPFGPFQFGNWWGTNPALRERDDVDVVAASPDTREILLGECKWRESFNESAAIEKLGLRSRIFEKDYDKFYYALFTKHPVSDATRSKHVEDGFLFMDVAGLYA